MHFATSLQSYTLQSVVSTTKQSIISAAQDRDDEYRLIKYFNGSYSPAWAHAVWRQEFDVFQKINSEQILTPSHFVDNSENPAIVFDFRNVISFEQAALDFSKQNLRIQLTRALSLVKLVDDIHQSGWRIGNLSETSILFDADTQCFILCDLSSASQLSNDSLRNTETHQFTELAYLAPEQTIRMEHKPDYRSDLYSLGVILFHLFSGRLPFTTNDAISLINQHLNKQAVRVKTLNDAVPEMISMIIAKLLSKHVSERYQSSFGLLTDIKKVIDNVSCTFTLAENDIPHQLILSDDIFGRDKELKQLECIYQMSQSQKSQLCFIKGFSGIGKSSLAHLLIPSVVASNALFVEGKAQQYQQNRPYDALIQCIEHCFDQLAKNNNVLLEKLCLSLSESMGDNLPIFVELLPNTKRFFNKQAQINQASSDAEARVQRCFLSFIEAFTQHCGLVIFLDDLQWLDQPTMNLLRVAFSEKQNSDIPCLFIGAYRDNEVNHTHPLVIAIDEIKSKRADVTEIELQPLSYLDVNHYLAASFKRSLEDTQSLTKICYKRTHGNPFYLVHLLKKLSDAGEFSYSKIAQQWQWHEDTINQYGVEESVVHFLTTALSSFDDVTKYLLVTASHLGSSFSFQNILLITQTSHHDCSERLFQLLDAGLIVPLNEHYRFEHSPSIQLKAKFKFSHDRVLQASHNLLDDTARLSLQKRIAYELLQQYQESPSNELLFITLNCFSDVLKELDDDESSQDLITLYLKAGRYAKETAAYVMAEQFLATAKQLLTSHLSLNVKQCCDLILPIYHERAEACYLSGQFDDAQALVEQGLSLLTEFERDLLEHVTLQFVLIDMRFIQGRFVEIMALLNDTLTQLDFTFPIELDEKQTKLHSYFIDNHLFNALENANLLALDDLVSQKYLLQMRAFNGVLFCAYQLGDFVAYCLASCFMVETTLQQGQCDYSANGITAFSTALSAAKVGYPACFRAGELAMGLVDHRNNSFFKIAVYDYFAGFYQHWGAPLQAGFDILRSAISMGARGANPLSAGFCAMKLPLNRLMHGDLLEEVFDEANRCLGFVKSTHQDNTENYILMSSVQPIKALLGKTVSPLSFDCDEVNLSEYFNGDFDTPSIHLAFYGHAMLRNAYLLHDIDTQKTFRPSVDVMSAALPDCPAYTDAHFYLGLSYCQELTFNDDKVLLSQAKKALALFSDWAEVYPDNFLHKQKLLKAELLKLVGDVASAMNEYRDAIDLAEEKRDHLISALAHELYGEFYNQIEQPQTSMFYLKRAWHLYHYWGAKTKCQQLARAWPSLMMLNQVQTLDKPAHHNSIADFIDIETLSRLTQKISSDIRLDPLMKNVLTVFNECTGSSMGAIALMEQDQLAIKYLIKDADHEQSTQLIEVTCENQLASQFNRLRVCYDFMNRSVIQKKPVVDNAHVTSINHNHAHSHMALPIIAQDDLVIGALYLENQTQKGTFTQKHITLLNTLMGQVGVSLMNAQMYNSLESLVEKRTKQLEMLTLHDSLTNLTNRRGFEQHFERQWRTHLRNRASLTVMMLDIDFFKQFNDSYGHPAGDACLIDVAQVLKECVYRSEDLVARYGGEEFVIVIANADMNAANLLANRIIEKMNERKLKHEHSKICDHVTLSIGVSTVVPTLASDKKQLLQTADKALYSAKKNGRNQYCVFK